MGVMTLVHHGLGLWIDRESHWDILFPRAELMLDSNGVPLAPHAPTLLVDAEYAGAPLEIDLSDTWVSLLGQSVSVKNARLRQPFMIGLHRHLHSPSRATDPFREYPKLITGGVSVEKGVLTPASLPLIGPVEFNGNTHGPMLAYKVALNAPLAAPQVTMTLTSRNDSSVRTVVLHPYAGRPHRGITFTLRVLADNDFNGTRAPNGRDEDFAAHYLLSGRNNPPPSRDIPIIPDFSMSVASSTSAPAVIMLSEDHLCGQAFGCDDSEACP